MDAIIKGGEMEDKPYQITYMSGPINVTLRMDKKTNLVSDLEEIVDQCRKSPILNAKESVSNAPKTVSTPQNDVQATCSEHNVGMQQGTSKKTGKPYFYHRSASGEMCFGRGYLPKGK